MRRIRRNLVRMPSKLDANLRAQAVRSGVAEAERRALIEEQRTGIEPLKATPEGIVGEDYVHLLLAGERSFAGVAKGAAFYDPVIDEAVLIAPKGSEVLIEAGNLHLEDRLGDEKHRAAAMALDHLRQAYGEDAGVVSRWLVSLVNNLAGEALDQGGIAVPTWRILVPNDPMVIWRELGKRWVVQPWGLGIDVRLGDWV
jgi:hypothetical protein